MFSLFRLIICTVLTLWLISCATSTRQVFEEEFSVVNSQKFAAWQLDDSGKFVAINALLNEVDGLIENNSLDVAEDKLERVLRIKAGYAPAWSRLSWMALESNSPKRAVQMAKRSNSFALGNHVLQTLNWSFIRDASQLLNDEDTFHRASQIIDSLQ